MVWIELVKSVVAALELTCSFGRVAASGILAGSDRGMVLPADAFFVLWQGYELTSVVAWYPGYCSAPTARSGSQGVSAGRRWRW